MLSSLDQSFSRQRRFVADASYELRTPVAVIRNKAGIALLETPTLPEAITTLHEIRGETERLSQLISDLLTLARMDEGQVRFERGLVQFDRFVETVVETLHALITERRIQLDLHVQANVVPMGDEVRLIQLVMNLLENAIYYTNPKGYVTVTVEKTSAKARLTIRDIGIVIIPEHLSHLFERFYRADPSRRQTERNSSGLGLAIFHQSFAWREHMRGEKEDKQRDWWSKPFTL
ncbi:sensor histidine kinase [Ktedonospora formicarum]|uniref:histidine kinase n=1 Tax=Ktedonospora formicarum TaxID=2778364 RepID=A0A8J3IB68_9CHLR|nr:HAMP domain-containing sensor histidine kinase [Ktedonospora formicarum]GHO50678.1 hypothetical protein KSX_88410 [Ktedonospora formicarum]